MKKAVRIILTLLVALSAFSFWRLSQRETLSQQTLMKRAHNSQFIKLSEGWTEYNDKGPRDAEPLILIHGFSVPMFFWEPLERRLLKRGFRIISYNQYGRGYSSRPDATYDRQMYMNQLRELMDSLNIKKAHLVGQSMGAALAGHFASLYPERTESVVLLSPMLDKASDNGGVSFCRTPIIGSPITNLLIANIIYKRSHKLVYSCENVPHETWLANMREQAKIKGFRRSLIKLFLSDALENYQSSYQKLGELAIPTMMVIGGKDNSVPQEHFNIIDSCIPQMRPLIFPDNNHVVVIQQVEEVSGFIYKFVTLTAHQREQRLSPVAKKHEECVD